MRTFLPVGHALQLVLEGVRPRDDAWMERDDWLGAAGMEGLLGRRLSRDVVAQFDVPAFASSAMDGYAVRHVDLGPEGGSLRVVSHAPAGAPAGGPLHAGEAVRIMTGAPVPDGTTAVVPVEWTRPGGSHGPERSGTEADGVWASADGGEVVIDRPIEAGKHVRPAAEDVRRGETVLHAGAVITPPVVGVLAGLGVDRVAVQYRPRVRVISTGDEIVDPALTPLFGQVRNTNGPGLAAQVLLAGGQPEGVDRAWYHVRDDVDALSQAISDGVREADVIVLSGGVSMGAHDHVQDAMRRAGVEPVFWKVRQRPGKPLLYGRTGAPPWGSGSGSGSGSGAGASEACHVFGLPGNPVSAAMCFEMYVRPLLDGLAGRSTANWSNGAGLIHARLDEDIRKPEGLHWFVRGVAHVEADGWHVRTTGAQGSNLYGSVLQANCVVHLAEEDADPVAGSSVAIQWLPWTSRPGAPIS